ncbi:hypothetical protein [Clostridium porci]|uniref:Uncharacterized protein n=1 Tax=Clostridium porci TaxID=2605778 RepID=A0A7X2TEK9_9CLOT|nr:hypothetical protein [Clostridium porci]MSS38333.1 hypothetical protein [Clostridium porci]
MMITSVVKKTSAEMLKAENYGLYLQVYDAAKEVRQDLYQMHYSTNPEDRYVATACFDDDLAEFMKLIKQANIFLSTNYNMHLTRYDDELRKKGGKYALTKEIITVWDAIMFEAHQQNRQQRLA